MADRYWVGGNGTWNGTNTTNWSTTSGGSGGASVPTALDAVYFDNNSGTTSTTALVASGYNPVCLSLDQTSAAPRINGNSNTLIVGNSSGGGTNSGRVFSQSIWFTGFISIELYGNTSGPSSTISLGSMPSTFLFLKQGVFTLATDITGGTLRVFLQGGTSFDVSSRTLWLSVISVDPFCNLTATNASIETDSWYISASASVTTDTMLSLTVPNFFSTQGTLSDARTGGILNYPMVTLGAGNGNAGGTSVNIPSGARFGSLTIRGRGVTFTGGQAFRIPSFGISSLSTNPYAALTASGTGQVTLEAIAPLSSAALDGLIISNCNATGVVSWTANVTSIDAGNNTGIRFANSPGFLAFFN